jgi:hypothetical protein
MTQSVNIARDFKTLEFDSLNVSHLWSKPTTPGDSKLYIDTRE